MQKSTKRLLSMLMVLALVLTLAPAGILAVETKAALSDAVLQKIANAAAIQAKALTLTATSTECPCHPGEAITWEPLPTDAYVAAAGDHKHFYVEGTFNGTAGNQIQLNNLTATDSFCLLLINNAQVNLKGRLLFNATGGTYTANIMGSGVVQTDNTANTEGGLLSITGSKNATLNIYGGTFRATNTAHAKPVLYMAAANSYFKVNMFNDVVIGGETVPTADSAAAYNVVIGNGTTTSNGGGELYMYGGTIQNGFAKTSGAQNGGNIYMYSNTKAKFYMYGGTITGGRAVINGGNIWVGGSAIATLYAGTLSNGYAGSYGGNLFANGKPTLQDVDVLNGNSKNGGNIAIYSGKLTMTDDTSVTGGNARTDGTGGNIYLNGAQAGTLLKGTISDGTAKSYGGNVSVINSTDVTIACDLTGGHGYAAGNLYVSGATSKVTLDGAALLNATCDLNTTIQHNGRVDSGVLSLKNGATSDGGVLFLDARASILNVDSSFSGDFTLWQNGATYALGDAVRYFTCNGAFTGLVKNANSKLAVAANGQTDTWLTFAMEWDGSAGLKVPAQGVVYNGALRGAASAQAAVDAYVAAMADEEIEEKPQYVMINGDVNIGDKEVVIDALADITVSGTGTVYGIDRKNDNYAATAGSITVAGPAVGTDVTAGGRHYVALKDGDAYTFHRVKADLVSVTVNVDKAGLYYKAEYKFDEAVKARVQSYGVLVALNEEATENSLKTSSEDLTGYADATLTAASHGVYGIFKTTNDDATNIENGESELNGNPYLAIDLTGEGEATIIDATNVAMSMAGAMELANEKWEALDETAQANLNTFVGIWKNAFSAETLEKLTNFTIN